MDVDLMLQNVIAQEEPVIHMDYVFVIDFIQGMIVQHVINHSFIYLFNLLFCLVAPKGE